jgi:DMSO/TMAO reductase YedYZ heme-binding membrane subunit
MIKRLGGQTWRRLHRLVYVAAVLGCLHYIWLAKKVLVQPWLYAGLLASCSDPRIRLRPQAIERWTATVGGRRASGEV